MAAKISENQKTNLQRKTISALTAAGVAGVSDRRQPKLAESWQWHVAMASVAAQWRHHINAKRENEKAAAAKMAASAESWLINLWRRRKAAAERKCIAAAASASAKRGGCWRQRRHRRFASKAAA
jgi:hypothetical protein